ncbi:TPA: hypothetical protein P0E30_003781 [Vibrio harveyi]|nr:hypothetical protein [Vibrio harveyi]
MHHTIEKEDVANRLRVISSLMECESLDHEAKTFIQNTVLSAADMVELEEGEPQED